MFFLSSPSPATTMAPPVCVAAPANAVVNLSPATTLSLDPMDLDLAAAAAPTTTMPHGIKRKLNLLYQSMGESARKHTKTRVLVKTWAHHKRYFRLSQDWHFSTPEFGVWTSVVCKEMAVKCLFFRHMPNAYSFDFTLASNSQCTVPTIKSAAHDISMYLFRGNVESPFAAEYLSFAQGTSPAPSSAPLLATNVVSSPAPILASLSAPAAAPVVVAAPVSVVVPSLVSSVGPVVPPALAPVMVPTPPAPVAATSAPPAPPVPSPAASQNASMDVDELPLSHPSRLGNCKLVRKEGWQLEGSAMRKSLNNLDNDDRWMKAEAERIKAEAESGLAGREAPLSEDQPQPEPPVKRLCPFDEEDEDEDEEKKKEERQEEEERMEEDSPTSTTPPGSPLRPSQRDQDSDESASSQSSSSAQDPAVQQVRAPIIVPVFFLAPTAVVDSGPPPMPIPSPSASTVSTVSNVSASAPTQEDDSEDLRNTSNDSLIAVDDSPSTDDDQTPSSPQASVSTPEAFASAANDNTSSSSGAMDTTSTAPASGPTSAPAPAPAPAPALAPAIVSTVVPTAADAAAAASVHRAVGTQAFDDSLTFMIGYECSMAKLPRL